MQEQEIKTWAPGIVKAVFPHLTNDLLHYLKI